MLRTRRSGLPEYKLLGKGYCLNVQGSPPRYYSKSKAFSTIGGCRDLCTTLSAACVGYTVVVSGGLAGLCRLYGFNLPDEGTGAAAPGEPLDGWGIFQKTYCCVSDMLTGVMKRTGWECYAKLPGASGVHPLV